MNNKNKEMDILRELSAIMNNIGEFPSRLKLKELGKGSLIHCINCNGGIDKFREILDCPLPTVPDGYFNDINNVKSVINDCISALDLSEFPTINQLEKFRGGIKFAIRKYHGGYRKLREKFEVDQLSKPAGYWKDLNNVIREIELIELTTLIFPSVNDINELGPSGLYAGINLYHGGLNELQKRMGRPISYKSKLEQKVKEILNMYVNSTEFIDNGRLKLNNYGIYLTHPYTKRPLELDRYYSKFRVAIEVQGIQHETEVAFFAKQKGMSPKEYLDLLKEVDKSKKEQCLKQNIILIYVYPGMSASEILDKIKDYLPIREEPVISKDITIEIKERLQRLEREKGAAITSNDIKKESQPLYKDVISSFGTLCEARKQLKLIPIREARNSWTINKVEESLKDKILELGRMPKKHELPSNLYSATVKFGGLSFFNYLL